MSRGGPVYVFTPPYSHRATGTVTTKHLPTEPVSTATYRAMLARRIQEMVDDTDPDEAKVLLKPLAMQEGLILTRDLTQAGHVLAEYSQTLRELAGYPMEPIDQDAFKPDHDTHLAISEETLEEWVMTLLRD